MGRKRKAKTPDPLAHHDDVNKSATNQTCWGLLAHDLPANAAEIRIRQRPLHPKDQSFTESVIDEYPAAQLEGSVPILVRNLEPPTQLGYEFACDIKKSNSTDWEDWGSCTRIKRTRRERAAAPAPAPAPAPVPAPAAAPVPAGAAAGAAAPVPAAAAALDPDLQPGGKSYRPTIALLQRDFSTGNACAKLLDEILKHPDLHKQRRGDIGENIFAMLAPAEFEVPFAEVAIVGAHERGGVGDGGKDVIICDARNPLGNRIHIVDVKAWRTGNVGAKQVRSIGGALGVQIPGQRRGCNTKIAIVATNQAFTDPAKNYSIDFNANPDNGANKVILWDGKKFKDMITGAASDTEFGWSNNVGQFIKDVLCYLDHKGLICCEAARTNRPSLQRKVGNINLDDLFTPGWAQR